ncbi:MAG TPA: SUMF1/EgtB/PvdO family nonheme iron enzyme [Phototrophicaceae bacterium]|nr:SUMF1/EgtB/PvdO family nonheme iron enzyme [Phototrophicaceae bacterium]
MNRTDVHISAQTGAQTIFDQITSLIAPYRELDQLRDCLTDGLMNEHGQTTSHGHELPTAARTWIKMKGIGLLTDLRLPIPARAALGQVIGLLELDTRPGVGLQDDGLPNLAWCEIPAGTFLMGSDKKRDPYAYRIEIPQKQVTLGAYHIAKYLVTYAQFQAFAEARDYFAPAWWQDFPNTAQAQDLEAQAFPYSNHPREMVTWYQAVAFCRWLTAHYRASGMIAAYQEIRLPTEQEWEKAARGTGGSVYPYGDDADIEQANISETKLGQTSTVGIFPDGVSPYGVHDMSGNVYEWCLTKYQTPDNHQIDASGVARVLRGGSFFLGSEWSRGAHRYEREPDVRLNDFGFRVVLASIPV